jgi:phosphoglycerate dehydrogenase-like enzyme
MSRKAKAAFFLNLPAAGRNNIDYVFANGRREHISEITELYPEIVTFDNFESHVANLSDLEVIFSTWGVPILTKEQIDRLPSLKAFFFAAGSVKYFAKPYLEKGITIVSAWAANAIPVAEFCLGQILLSCKGYFSNTRLCRKNRKNTGQHAGRGIYGETVALIGVGQIAKYLINLLKPFNLNIIVVDPYLSDGDATVLGVKKVSLDEAFSQAYVVSNHLPDLPDLEKVLNGKLFASMQPDATFINTGRGRQINEKELIDTLKQRSDLTALIDVTFPEPASPESELYNLDNVSLSSHVAGSINSEVVRMADYVIEEYKRWASGQSLKYAITPEIFEKLA